MTCTPFQLPWDHKKDEEKREKQNHDLKDENESESGDEGAFDGLMAKVFSCAIGGGGATNACEEQ